MAEFVLVHGAFHGSWCWNRLALQLQTRGHTVAMVDLPCEDPHAGLEEYADTVGKVVETCSEAPVLVGHSLGGLTIPLVADRWEVMGLIYLCAYVPDMGKGVTLAGADDMAQELDVHDDGTLTIREEVATRWFYHDCPADLVERSVARLRPQGMRPWSEPYPLRTLPEVPRAYVMTKEDRPIPPSYAAKAAKVLLGVEPVEIAGSHSPMLSRPRELSAIFDRIVAEFLGN